MCTLTLAWRAFPDVPVALAANRDESLERASEPPTVRGAERRFLAPRDAEAGGTWIGVNDAGVVVAVTNRWLERDRKGERSRGLLVEDCLREPSAEAAVRAVEREVADRDYDGFNLVLAGDAAAFMLSYDGSLAVTRLDPGVHVVGNVGGVVNGEARFAIPDRRAEFGGERAESARRIAGALVPEPGGSGEAWLDRASEVLADHAYGACLHGDGYGTRSFTRIRTGSVPAVAFADGPPCETPVESIGVPADFRTESQF
ncbi:Transport and Golgi organisation 2 [Halorubrum aquaticum]|uniref:Transport and Golgi organisation 2 n=1 Tax=Halorubrum aquaticum TaxID=387340 RepID=A0A1I3BC53_9EURY|nr:NRDE family protein [Halorubrum aquaticum]SFH59873.1 Transport and Golgi organisation 2 [Halorubrum aquaticum]